MVWDRRLIFYGGSVIGVVDNSGAINGGADDSLAIDGSSVLSIVDHAGAIHGGADDRGAIDGSSVLSILNNSGAINGGPDDSSAIDGCSYDCSADCAVWPLHWVLGRQWGVLRRVQGILRPLPPVHMVRRASSLREPETLRGHEVS